MKIGILGTRGIPNAYGGFEEFAQHLAEGLLQRGHEVFVYNSSLHPYKEKQWQGVKIIHCKDWENKLGTTGQFLYDLNCINDARKRNYAILLQLGYTSNSIWFWRWSKNSINIVNMDGLEWKREKYSKLIQRFLKKAEAWAVKHADHLVADSKGIQEHLLRTYNRPSTYIPYAAELFNDPEPSFLAKLELAPQQYYLLIARMEPENNIETIIKGYLNSKQDGQLLIIGGTENKYGKRWVNKYASDKIKFAGAIYEKDILNNLRHYSKLYFHGHSVGGTNPSLLEAMACRCNIAAHDNIFNKAILLDNSYYFSTPEEVSQIINLHPNPAIIQKRKEINAEKIRTEYSWNKIIDDYENVFIHALSNSK